MDLLMTTGNEYRAVFENTGTATIIVEADTTIALANGTFTGLSGYGKEEIEGKKSWTEFILKDDLDRSGKLYSPAASSAGQGRSLRYRSNVAAFARCCAVQFSAVLGWYCHHPRAGPREKSAEDLGRGAQR